MGRVASPHIPEGKILLTYTDYCALPNDGKRYELHEGELSVMPAPVPRHQQVLRNLFRLLDRYLETHPRGQLLFAPVDVILGERTVVQPDLVFLSHAKTHLITSRGIEGPPDLVVEVLSPSTAELDRITKAQLYARYGIPHYWLVDPERETFHAYELAGPGYRLSVQVGADEIFAPSLLPELTIRPHEIFAG